MVRNCTDCSGFEDGQNLFLSFLNCEDITPAFLSQDIGQLYYWFPEDQISASLKIIDLSKNKTFARSGFQSPPHLLTYVTYTKQSGFDVFTVNKAPQR